MTDRELEVAVAALADGTTAQPTGLVDIHCHGALGAQFGDDSEGSRRAAAHHHAAGVTRLVASLVTAPAAHLEAQVRVLAPLVADGTLAGIHLEGPFISHERCGAHDPALLLLPQVALVERLADTAASHGAPGAIRQLTYAPELPGSLALVRACLQFGIRPAVGHTNADAHVVDRALRTIADAQGAPALVTHLFNGMPPLHHRAGGPVAAALSAARRGEAIVELIADGVHVAAETTRMVFDLLGPHAIALVSDAMAATGLGDGSYRLGSLAVRVAGGIARTEATGSIAGSTATLADCVAWSVTHAGIDPRDAELAATVTPLVALGLV